MSRDVWKAKVKCPDCGNLMKKDKVLMQGIEVRAWKCRKCGQTMLHPLDAEVAFLINKLKKKAVEVKVGKLGESIVIRIPKQISEALHISQGALAQIIVEDKDTIEVKIKKRAPA